MPENNLIPEAKETGEPSSIPEEKKPSMGEKLKNFFSITIVKHLIIVTLVLGSMFALSHSGLFTNPEASFYDTNFYGRAVIKGQYNKVPDNIIILSVDDSSLNELAPTLGTWPWARASYSTIIDTLNGYGAKAIGLDFLFITESTRGEADDAVLANALAKYNNVLIASNFDISQSRQGTMEQLILPLDKFIINDNYGFINYDTENDGFLRKMMLTKEYQEVKYRSFDAKLYQIATGQEINKDGGYINFYGPPNHFPVIPVYKLFDAESLHNELDDGKIFKDKIIIIGPTAEAFHDTHATPYSANQFFAHYLEIGSAFPMSGPEVHANAIATLMQGNDLQELNPAIQYAILFVVLMVLASVFTLAGLWIGLVSGIFILIAYWLNAYFYFTYYSSFINIFVMLWSIIILFVVIQAVKYIETLRQKMYIQNSFSSYVPKQLVNQLLSNPKLLDSFEGEKKDITVMFVDIRGFTSLSDTMDAKEVVKILNQYIEIVIEAIEPYGGIIDKFIGDGVMITFNTLESQPDHQVRAVMSALAIKEKIKEWLKANRKGRRDLFAIGIGISSGLCMVGNMGARDKKSFTAIGATVNMAARLESRARGGNSIIMSESVYSAVKDTIEAVFVEETVLKGFITPVSVYEVLSRKGEAVPAPETNLGLTAVEKAQTQASTNMFDR